MKKIVLMAFMIFISTAMFLLPCLAEEIIYGCYQKNNGQLRIVKGSDECRPSEVFIQWNEVGPQGPKGDKGDKGDTGAQGPAGPADPTVLEVICQLAKDASLPCPTFCDCSKTVFVSSQLYDGNLGGLIGADAKCQALADAAGLPGTFKAWISPTAFEGPATRFTHSPHPYKRVDGIVVASNWADLVDGALSAPINISEYGAYAGDAGYAWTCTGSDGIAIWVDDHCASWTIGSGGWGLVGVVNATNPMWTHFFGNADRCYNLNHLYCFQQ